MNFNFDEHRDKKMGFLRRFVRNQQAMPELKQEEDQFEEETGPAIYAPVPDKKYLPVDEFLY